MWYIYFVESDEWIKIGLTYQLRQRIAEIRRHTQKEITLLGYLFESERKKAYALESKLKWRFWPGIDGPYQKECFLKRKEIYDYIRDNCIYYDDILSSLTIPSSTKPSLKKQIKGITKTKIWVKSKYHGEPCYILAQSTS